MIECYSHRQSCELGPIPPRMPDRADAQVPHDRTAQGALYGRIGHFYFYEQGGTNDPAFGLIDIEVSVRLLGPGRALLEAYAIGDGFQSCGSNGRDAPLMIELHGPDCMLASAQWVYGDILCGHADPLTLSKEIDLSEADFARLQRVVLAPVNGKATACH